jgi:hypothetical protein
MQRLDFHFVSVGLSAADSDSGPISQDVDRVYAEVLPYKPSQASEIIEAWERSVRLSKSIRAVCQGPAWTNFCFGTKENALLVLLKSRVDGHVSYVTPFCTITTR